jgi:hypothetical protein
MPVKRRLAKVKTHRITPAAIEAFEVGDCRWLHVALGLAPWQASPLDALFHERPDYGPDLLYTQSWDAALGLLADLRAAGAREPPPSPPRQSSKLLL